VSEERRGRGTSSLHAHTLSPLPWTRTTNLGLARRTDEGDEGDEGDDAELIRLRNGFSAAKRYFVMPPIQQLVRLYAETDESVYDSTLCRDGSALATVEHPQFNKSLLSPAGSAKITVRNATTGIVTYSYTNPPSSIGDISLSHDGSKLAYVEHSNSRGQADVQNRSTVRVVETGSPTSVLFDKTYENTVTRMSMSANAKVLAVVDADSGPREVDSGPREVARTRVKAHFVGEQSSAASADVSVLDYADPWRHQLTHCELSEDGDTLLTLDTVIRGGGPVAFALRLHSITQSGSATLLATLEEESRVALSACLLGREMVAVAGPSRRGGVMAQDHCVRVLKFDAGHFQELWTIHRTMHSINVSHFVQSSPPLLLTNEARCVSNSTETSWVESKVSVWNAETGEHLRDFGYANKVATATAAATKNGKQLDVLAVEHGRTTGPYGTSHAMITLQTAAGGWRGDGKPREVWN
jgi:hypothetical protein